MRIKQYRYWMIRSFDSDAGSPLPLGYRYPLKIWSRFLVNRLLLRLAGNRDGGWHLYAVAALFDGEDGDIEGQLLAGQGVVRINRGVGVVKRGDLGKPHPPVRPYALELGADLTRLLGDSVQRHLLGAAGINLAIAVLGRHHDFFCVAGLEAEQSLLKSADQLASAVDVDQRLLADVGAGLGAVAQG